MTRAHPEGPHRPTRLLYQETVSQGEIIKNLNHTDFYIKSARRIALRNCGVINPEVIEEYIARGGYQGPWPMSLHRP